MTVNWINPKDKLPETDCRDVWIAVESKYRDAVHVIIGSYFVSNGFAEWDSYYQDYNYFSDSKVLAWAPFESPEFSKDMFK